MFTGLIEEIGTIQAVVPYQLGRRFTLLGTHAITDLAVGDSIAVNGVCLTVVEHVGDRIMVEAVPETLHRSTLSSWQVGTSVNLERALQVGGRLGGHFVQGHVDALGQILRLEKRAPGYWLEVGLPKESLAGCVDKGSVAIDGVSLTIAAVHADSLSIAVIPHTAERTTLSRLRPGERVNVELDILGKYVRRFLAAPTSGRGLTLEQLSEWGF